MNNAPELVLCYDILLRYPELLLNFPDSSYGDMVLDLSKTIGASPMRCELGSENELTPRLRDCAIAIPEYSIDALCLIRDNADTAPIVRQRANTALQNLASVLSGRKAQMIRKDHDHHTEAPSPQNSRPGTPTECAVQAFAQFVKGSGLLVGSNRTSIFVSNLPEIRARHSHMITVSLLQLHLPSPWEYHGIRYLLVPPDFIESFNVNGHISHDAWHALFPDAPPLQPNEYLAFYPAGADESPRELDEQDPIVLTDSWCGADNIAYHERLGRYSAENDCIEQRHFNPYLEIPRGLNGSGNPAYAAYLDALADPKISYVIVSGPAGSGKTFGAFNYARESVRNGQFMHAVVLKEGKNVLGAVKGNAQDKMMPLVEFGKDALRSIELKSGKMHKKRRDEARFGRRQPAEGQPTSSVYEQLNESVELSWENFFTTIPYEYAQGRNLPDLVIIADEIQRADPDIVYTLLTRLADGAKLIVMGDVDQIFASTEQKRRVNGLVYASRLLYGNPEVVQIRLNLTLRHSVTEAIIRNRRQVHLELGLPL